MATVPFIWLFYTFDFWNISSFCIINHTMRNILIHKAPPLSSCPPSLIPGLILRKADKTKVFQYILKFMMHAAKLSICWGCIKEYIYIFLLLCKNSLLTELTSTLDIIFKKKSRRFSIHMTREHAFQCFSFMFFILYSFFYF